MYEFLIGSVRDMKAGSRNARIEYERMASAYGSDLYRYGFWLCSDSGKTYHLVVKTFDSAWKEMANSRESRIRKTWLFSELRKEYFDELKRSGAPQAAAKSIHKVANQNPHQRPLGVQELRGAISALPLEFREPLVLRELNGFNCSEIGSICNISESIAKKRLLQAKRELSLFYNQRGLE